MFPISRQAAITRVTHFFQRVIAGEMNNINGRTGHFGVRADHAAVLGGLQHGHVEMSVYIDTAGDDDAARGVN